jgi:hypothetical protein
MARLATALLLLLCPAPLRADDALERAAWASVRVDVAREDGRVAGGSGTLVRWSGRVLVLTCRHVVPDDSCPIVVTLRSGRTLPATFLAADARADLAAVNVPAARLRPVALAADELAPGAPVLQIGCPGCYRPRVLCYRRGERLDVDASAGGVPVVVLRFAEPIVSGDSGSGLFAGGRLCGVVWGSNGDTASATGAAEVRRFLESLDGE